MNFREFQYRLAEQRCWLDDEPTHASHAGQRQCPRCRRKWSYTAMRRNWRLAELFCSPSNPEYELHRDWGASPDNFGSGHEFTVSNPAQQVIDRVHAAVLLKHGDRVAGVTIPRARKGVINAHAVGRTYTEFELCMLLDYMFEDPDERAPLRAGVYTMAGLHAVPPAEDDTDTLLDALRVIAAADQNKFREILDPILDIIWSDRLFYGGYEGRLSVLYRQFFAPRLHKLGVPAAVWA